MAMRVSPSASSAISLLNCKQPPPVSCIRVPCLSRSSPPSLSYAFNPLRYSPFSSISISLVPSLSLTLLFRFKKVLHRSRRKQKRRVSCPLLRSCSSHSSQSAMDLYHFLSMWLMMDIRNIVCRVLILARGTAVPKSYIVPLFALQAPAGVVSWIKGRYGVWTAFLALLIRLFFYIPGELELPFLALLLLMVAPYEAMKLRYTKEGAVISLLISVYLAFQHFSRTSLQQSFDQADINYKDFLWKRS
ncbi:Cold-regulated 413 inner membrane protein 2, chloroplastic [Glycine soja]